MKSIVKSFFFLLKSTYFYFIFFLLFLDVAFISLSTEEWLKIWCETLSKCAVASDMPLWLRYFQNILFKSLDSGNLDYKRVTYYA